MDAEPTCGPCHWGLRWSSLWGCEACDGCAEMGAVVACERSHWGLRWSSLWGHETLSWVMMMMTMMMMILMRGGEGPWE